jgi:hypothetical protein
MQEKYKSGGRFFEINRQCKNSCLWHGLFKKSIVCKNLHHYLFYSLCHQNVYFSKLNLVFENALHEVLSIEKINMLKEFKGQSHEEVCEIMIWDVSFGQNYKVRQQFLNFAV